MSHSNQKKTKKKKHIEPKIKSEKLLSFGALCNGKTSGGRKAAAGAPNFCSASKLLS